MPISAALVHTPVWTYYTPPLNVTYLAAFAKRAGFEARVFDLNAEWFARSRARADLWERDFLFEWQDEEKYRSRVFPAVVEPNLEGDVDRILASGPRVVGISVLSKQVAYDLARAVRKRAPGVVVVAGGQVCWPGFYGRELAESGLFDAVVFGEGEETLLDILRAAETGRRLSGIAGTLANDGGTVRAAPPRPHIRDLDAVPFPDYSDLDFRLYNWGPQSGYQPSSSVSVLASRGCTGKCDFCLQEVIWGEFRMRSPLNVVEEMEARFTESGVANFVFNDLLINASLARLEELCDELIIRGSRFTWGGDAVIDRRMGDRLLSKLRRAGCTNLTFGIESAAPRVLQAMHKRYRAEDIPAVLAAAKKAGIRCYTNLIIGHPAETRADFLQTVRFLIDHHALMDAPPAVSFLVIQRGTRLHDRRDALGIHVNGGDSFGWSSPATGNDVDERRRRMQVLSFVVETLFGTEFRMTDSKVVEIFGEVV